jgi:hypothetical protein
MSAHRKQFPSSGFEPRWQSCRATFHVPNPGQDGLGTAMANEEEVDGKSEVGGLPVERSPLRQWMLRITACADRD